MKGSNSTLKDRGFIVAGGDLVWQEVHHHKLEETGCVLVTIAPEDLAGGKETDYLFYKLSKIPFEKGEAEPERPYFWSGLWNTCACSGHKAEREYVRHYATIEEAIQSRMTFGWKVWMTTFSELFPYGIKLE